MLAKWLNISGLIMDFVGVVFIWCFAKSVTGMTTPANIKHSGKQWRLEIGIALIAFGLAAQILSNFIG